MLDMLTLTVGCKRSFQDSIMLNLVVSRSPVDVKSYFCIVFKYCLLFASTSCLWCDLLPLPWPSVVSVWYSEAIAHSCMTALTNRKRRGCVKLYNANKLRETALSVLNETAATTAMVQRFWNCGFFKPRHTLKPETNLCLLKSVLDYTRYCERVLLQHWQNSAVIYFTCV